MKESMSRLLATIGADDIAVTEKLLGWDIQQWRVRDCGGDR
jgi:hypothetical protein